MAEKVCRLCLSTEDLMSVFDSKMVEDMPEIIRTTTGVEISRSDKITQMMCNTCCQITIKMFKFRTTSMKNDNELKAKYADAITIPTRPSSENSVRILPTPPPSSENAIRILPTPPPSSENAVRILPPPPSSGNSVRILPPQPIRKALPAKYRFAHPSVKKVLRKYPKLIVPENVLKSHIGAYITIMKDEVDEWYKEKKLSDEEIAAIKQEAGERALAEKSNLKEKSNREEESRKRKRSPQESEEITKKAPKLVTKIVSTPVETRVVFSSASVNPVPATKTVPPTENSGTKEVRENIKVIVNSESVRKVMSKHAVVKEKVPVSNNPPAKNDNTSILTSLLGKRDDLQEAYNNLTLKALLKSSEPVSKHIDDEVIEIINIDSPPPSESEPPKRTSVEKPSNSSNKEFVKTVPPVKIDQPKNVTNEINKGENSDDDTIVLDVDSASSNDSTSPSTTSTDKTTFTEALDLVPKGNMPDLSLLSVANKSHTLYICKVCDSHHPSLKEMKYHERKTHTKCPFCSKRFRTLAHREEHIKTTCSINRSPVKIKPLKLQLVRVDEIEEIRKKYASAFEVRDEEDIFEDTSAEVVQKESTDIPRKETDVAQDKAKTGVSQEEEDDDDDEDRLVICDSVTADAINELENFIKETDTIPHEEVTGTADKDEGKSDVICISDDETESRPKKMLNIVNDAFLKNIDINDNDLSILKQILQFSKYNKTNTKNPLSNLIANPIMDGNSNRVKVFKNLRRHLNKFKIPVQIKNGSKISVEYIPTRSPKPKKLNDLWYNTTAERLKPTSSPKNDEKKTNYSLLNGQASNPTPTTVQQGPVLYQTIAPKIIPAKVPPTFITSKPQPQTTVMPSTFITSNPQSSNTALLPATFITSNSQPSKTALVPATFITSNPQPSTKSVTFITSTSSPSQTTKMSTFIAPSPSPSKAIVLNNTTNICNNTTNNFTNFILLQSNLVTLPATQRPIAKIQSVIGAAETINETPPLSAVDTLRSITDSLMPPSTANDESVRKEEIVAEQTVPKENTIPQGQKFQPAIRVKDFKELS